jgi:hypothetical protein
MESTTSTSPSTGAATPSTSASPSTKASIDQAISKILQSNFDADSKVCLLTLIKLIDNLLQHPNHPKMRSIRLQNATIATKVVQTNGVDVLLACGFNLANDVLVLSETAEDTETLVTARKMLTHVAIHQLQLTATELPKFLPPKPRGTTTTPISNSFNVYQGQRYDGQSAAVGTNLGPPAHWKSATATKLEGLQQQQKKLERQLQKPQIDRQWVASRPTDTTAGVAAIFSTDIDALTNNNTSDAALLAAHLQKQQAARLQTTEGGFTTKAMRDLQHLKTQKVYSHTQLAIQFPDGCVVRGNFGPHETIGTVMASLIDHVLVASTKSTRFELYQTPPRTLLAPSKTLQALGLVPAAKVYVSWKQGLLVTGNTGWYLRPECFATPSSVAPSMPTSTAITATDGNNNGKQPGGVAKKKKTKAEKEANLLKRMLGN